jgi:hypothetical protein
VKTIKLDGREFAEIDQALTSAQNDYIQGHLALAGVTDLLVAAHTKKDEDTVGDMRREFITGILVSGEKSAILAGCLTEVGTKWTRASAEKNRERFDEITDREESSRMTTELVRLVIAFFQFGGTSSTTSPKSSSPNDAVPATENAELETSASSPQ